MIGKLRGKVAAAGARGDAELYVAGMSLFGENKGELAIAAQLEPGQVSLYGRWIGQPDGPLQNFVGIAAPQPDTKGASGFFALNVAPMLANAPAMPVAGDVTLDLVTREVTCGGRPVELQPREFSLLAFLLRHAGRPVSKTMILEHVWDYSFDPQTNVVDVVMSRLRAKIDADHERIETIRSVGYVFRLHA